MTDTFKDDEKLYRAVLPNGIYWKENGKLSSAAFLDRNGLSVDRGNYRPDDEAVRDLQNHLQGSIVSVTVKDCRTVEAAVLYRPSKRNIYHSEVHGSTECPPLSPGQRKHLANAAVVLAI